MTLTPTVPPSGPDRLKAVQVLTEAEKVRQEGGDVDAFLRKETRYMTRQELDTLHTQLTAPPLTPDPQLPEIFRQQTTERQQALKAVQEQLEALDLARREGSLVRPLDAQTFNDPDKNFVKKMPYMWSGKRWKDEMKWGGGYVADLAKKHPVLATVGGVIVLPIVGYAAFKAVKTTINAITFVPRKVLGWLTGMRPDAAAAPAAAGAPAAAPSAPTTPAPAPARRSLLWSTLKWLGIGAAVVGAGFATKAFANSVIEKFKSDAEEMLKKAQEDAKRQAEELKKQMEKGQEYLEVREAEALFGSMVGKLEKRDPTDPRSTALGELPKRLNAQIAKLSDTAREGFLKDVGLDPGPVAIDGPNGVVYEVSFNAGTKMCSLQETVPVILEESAYEETVNSLFVAHEALLASTTPPPVPADIQSLLLKPEIRSRKVGDFLEINDFASLQSGDTWKNFSDIERKAIFAVAEMLKVQDDLYLFGRMTKQQSKNSTLQEFLDQTGMFLRSTERLHRAFPGNNLQTGKSEDLAKGLQIVFAPSHWATEAQSPRVRQHIAALDPGLSAKEGLFVSWLVANANRSLTDDVTTFVNNPAPPVDASFSKAVTAIRKDVHDHEVFLLDFASMLDSSDQPGVKRAILESISTASLSDALQLSLYLAEARPKSGTLQPGNLPSINVMGFSLLANKLTEIVSRRDKNLAKKMYNSFSTKPYYIVSK